MIIQAHFSIYKDPTSKAMLSHYSNEDTTLDYLIWKGSSYNVHLEIYSLIAFVKKLWYPNWTFYLENSTRT